MKETDITSTHPLYDRYLPKWQRCRDAIAGADAVKEAAERYLPRLPGQDQAAYDAYRMRAIFYNATGRTLSLYTGLAFSKTPVITGLDPDDPLLADCDLAGTPFGEALEDALENVVGLGRFGVLVDYAGSTTPGSTQADARRDSGRAYLALYEAESITHWHSSRRNGRTLPDRIVLHEHAEDHTHQPLEQYRELLLDDEGYLVRIWRSTKDNQGKDTWTVAATHRPRMHDHPLTSIPFFFLDPEYGSPNPHTPPLLDLVDVNMSHYRTMADLEHGRFFCGLPTPIFAGFSFQEGETVKLGSLRGIASPAPDAKAYYLEFQGSGLASLESAAKQKEQWMSQLGGAFMETERPGIEAAETLRIKRAGSNATLASMALAVSTVMTKILKLLALWSGKDPQKVQVQLHTEYLSTAIDPQELSILLEAVQAGRFRQIDWLARCKVAGILPQDADVQGIEEELGRRIQKEGEGRERGVVVQGFGRQEG